MINSNQNVKKIFLIIYFIIYFSLFYILIITTPNTTYELSIYAIYPWYFWVLLSATFSLTGFLIFKRKYFNNYFVFFTWLSLILLYSIPLFRGYFLYGAGDTLYHLAYTGVITQSGQITNGDVYPASHVLLWVISNVFGISPAIISLLFLQIFLTSFVLCLFILSKIIFNKKEAILVVFFSTIPAYGSWISSEYIMPSTFAFFSIPMILFLFFKYISSDNKKTLPLLVFLLILLPFYHIEASLFITIPLMVIFIFSKIGVVNLTNKLKYVVFITLLSFAIYFLYELIFYGIVDEFSILISNLFGSKSFLFDVINPSYTTSISNRIKILIFSYGVSIVYIFIGLLVSIYVFYNYIFKKISRLKVEFIISLCFFTFLILNFIFLSTLTPISVHLERQLKYSVLVSTLELVIFIRFFIFNNRRKYLKAVSVLILIIMLSVIPLFAILSSFSSPLQNGVNYQITYSDVSAMNFLFTNYNSKLPIMEIGFRAYQLRFGQYLLGPDYYSNMSYVYSFNVLPVPHFGYPDPLGSYYPDDSYLLIYPPNNYLQITYPVTPILWYYDPSDFSHLYNDSSVDLCYVNNLIQILYVSSQQR